MNPNQGPPPAARAMPLIAPIHVLPHPCMTETAIAKVGLPGNQSAIVFQFATPTGVQMYFVEESAAKQIAKQIDEATGSGIIVVPADAAPPPPPERRR